MSTLAVVAAFVASTAAWADDPGIAPINDVAPAITGAERLGQTLAASHGTWSGDAPVSFAYQWRRCDRAGATCTDIAQAVNASYRLADDDLGHTLRVVVTATNAAGSTSAATVATDVVGSGEVTADAPDTATHYGYDAAGRLSSVVGRDADAVAGDPLESAFYRWDAVGNLLAVQRRSAITPVIDEVHPDHGAPGSKVTISGVGFTRSISATTVRFAGVEADVVDASASRIVVRVPGGAVDGAISVVVPGGTATSPEPFDAVDPNGPHITGMSPVTVYSTNLVGDVVTLTGSNFAEELTENGGQGQRSSRRARLRHRDDASVPDAAGHRAGSRDGLHTRRL